MARKFRRFIPHLIVMLASIVAYFFYDHRTHKPQTQTVETHNQHASNPKSSSTQSPNAQTSSCNPPQELLSGKKYANSGCLIVQNGEILVVSRKNKPRKKHGENSQKNTENSHKHEKSEMKSAIPGGRKNQDELAPCTAQRRTFELTGIEVVATKKLFTAKNGFTVFLCEAKIPIPQSQKFHGSDVLLANPAKIANYKYPEQLNEIKVYLARKS